MNLVTFSHGLLLSLNRISYLSNMKNFSMKNVEVFALKAHERQKYGEKPYEVHLRQVVNILKEEGYSDNSILIAAGWLHDVIEDTNFSAEEIEQKFGFEVRDIVYRVSDESGESRKERKLKTYPKIKGHKEATIIKLCDRIANVEASMTVPKKFKMYFDEYPEFKSHLYQSGVADSLWARLEKLLMDNK
jgi:(p)ppGpp synthase/HD superfamily hydrolase